MSRLGHALVAVVVALAASACPDDERTGSTSDATAASDAADSAVGDATATATETVASDTAVAETTTAAETVETHDDAADATATDTAATDTQATDTQAAVPEVVACPTPSLLEQYPPPLPPFPYGFWPEATGCLALEHDVIIVLGCPSEEDGAPSDCQEARAALTDQLWEAGFARRVIVTGAAVHTPWVEAEALHALLVARGIPSEAIVDEPLARHTDENLYYATRIMEREGWRSAIVVSEDPGHLMFTGLCDANCCVQLGRMTLVAFPIGGLAWVKAGHYALTPPGPATTPEECTHLTNLAMCVNLDERKACKDDFQLAR